MDSKLYTGKRILDIKYGDINGDGKLEKVVLTGEEFYPHSVDVKDLQLVIYEGDNIVVTQPVPGAAGSDFELILKKFTRLNREQIMIIGKVPTPPYDYLVALIYWYEKRHILEIFNGAKFAVDNACTAMYLDNYLVEVLCPTNNIKHLLSIKKLQKELEGKVYDGKGKVITLEQPRISFIKEIYPMKLRYDDYYSLLVYQEIKESTFGFNLGYLIRRFSVDGLGKITGSAHMVAQQGKAIKTPFDTDKVLMH